MTDKLPESQPEPVKPVRSIAMRCRHGYSVHEVILKWESPCDRFPVMLVPLETWEKLLDEVRRIGRMRCDCVEVGDPWCPACAVDKLFKDLKL